MHSQNPTVSIIVPMYNAEKFVAQTIQSVIGQTYSSWELLLIDDGSTDKTHDVIQQYLSDDRIRYVHKTNGGQGSARNRGIALAKGEYLAFIDADDIWDASKLESQVTILREKKAALVFCKLRWIDARGVSLPKNVGSGSGFYEGFSSLFLLVAGNISIPNSSVVVKKEWVMQVGQFSESEQAQNIEDYHLWIRLLSAGAVFYGMDVVLGSYRKHDAQNTSEDPGQSIKLIAYLNHLSKHYPERKALFEFLILQRLSAYYAQHPNKMKAKKICLQIFYSNANIDSFWFEEMLINIFQLDNYFQFRRLIIRRFQRYDTFLKSIS